MVTPQQVLDAVPTQLWIGGPVDAGSGATFAVENPATAKPLVQVADAAPADAQRALDAAADAAPAWAATPARERSEFLRSVYQGIVDRAEEFALVMSLEMGKALPDSRSEVGYGAEFLRWFAEEAVRIHGRYQPAPGGSGRIAVHKQPVGPCLAITPWNFPLAMGTRKIGPALAAGCTMIVKPASATPLTMLLLAQVCADAGLPPGVLSVLTSSHSGAITDALLADSRLRKLTFTGSTPVGRMLQAKAAPGLLRTSMELGGNAPFLVFDDADIDAAVAGAMLAKLRNGGQACTAANRFLVHESVIEEFGRRLTERVRAFKIGRGTEDGVTIGPLIDDKAIAKVGELVTDAVGRGAQLLTGGHAIDGTGTFFEPTVLTGVSTEADIFREEIFGPIVTVIPFTDEADAVAKANATEYGLVSYAYTADLARGQRLIESLETGMMGLNVGVVSNAAAPFGGVKQSGIGREGGFEGIHEYLETKYVLTPDPFA